MRTELSKGKVVIYNDLKYKVHLIEESHIELVTEHGELERLKKESIIEKLVSGIPSLTTIDEDRLSVAKARFEIIKPVIEASSRKEVEEVAKANSLGTATLYRWIKEYKRSGLMSSLAPKARPGGKGKSRLDNEIDLIINENIEKHHLKDQRNSIQTVYFEVKLQCRERNLQPPHYNTVRRRIRAISEYEATKHRLGRAVARKKFAPKTGSFPDSLFPLSSVQIDHTPLDIIVVDKENRLPIGRPWLTMAIDTFSRMVVGFYLGMERPNSMSVGLCLSQSILPKEEYLAGLDIYDEWPCSGLISCIHIDNAREFRSKMIDEACMEYNMDVNWRPAKKPEYGGHIERLMGTFSKELHKLKGTTFESTKKRGEYNSEKRAVFSFEELEQYLALFIVNFYHQKHHSGIGCSPISKWNEGMSGSDDVIGVGAGIIKDERKVLLDFMPYEERTIQDYGVLIDGIHYYSDVLRKWINSVDIESGKLRAKRKFKFKMDPRDLSKVYFLDPEAEEYFPVPYRDSARPVINRWELRTIKAELQKRGHDEVDEDLIFKTHKRLREIEEKAEKETKQTRRNKTIERKQKKHEELINPRRTINKETKVNDDLFCDLGSFNDIDDGTS